MEKIRSLAASLILALVVGLVAPGPAGALGADDPVAIAKSLLDREIDANNNGGSTETNDLLTPDENPGEKGGQVAGPGAPEHAHHGPLDARIAV